MCTSYIRAIILALFVGASPLVYAQSPDASYTFKGDYLRTIYNNGIQALDAGDYLIAHRFLSTYLSITFGFGVFNENPQFDKQLNEALRTIEEYFQNAVAKRQKLQSELEKCQSRAAGGIIGSTGYGLTMPKIQLPRVPPER